MKVEALFALVRWDVRRTESSRLALAWLELYGRIAEARAAGLLP